MWITLEASVILKETLVAIYQSSCKLTGKVHWNSTTSSDSWNTRLQDTIPVKNRMRYYNAFAMQKVQRALLNIPPPSIFQHMQYQWFSDPNSKPAKRMTVCPLNQWFNSCSVRGPLSFIGRHLHGAHQSNDLDHQTWFSNRILARAANYWEYL